MGYQESLRQYIEATNTHDFSNVKRLLHQNAVYWFSKQTCTTMEEIQAYFEQAWDTIKNEVYSAADVQWIAVDNQCATCIYTYNWEGFYKGKFASGSGRATNVFVKSPDGAWKLIHEHLSSH